MKKVVLITNIPTPYRVPLFKELSEKLRQEGMALHVVFNAATYGRRLHELDPSAFGFDYTILDAATISRKDAEKTTFLYNGLTAVLNTIGPDAVIVSGFSPATLRVCLRRITKGTPFIIWNGSIESPYRREGTFKKRMRRWLAARASGFIAYGTRAKEYLVAHGAGPDKVSIAINTVDTAFFREETRRLKQSLPAEPCYRLLSVGYLSPRKGTVRLIELMRTITRLRKDIVLDIVGEGEDRPFLEQQVKEYGLSDCVFFHGFVPRERLPEHFAKAAVYLFQTEFDIWGLVLNEAMAAGIPVIASPNAGAARDLIKEGVTGYVRDFQDPHAVAALVEQLVDRPELAKGIAAAASEWVTANATLSASADGFVEALRRIFSK